MNRHANPRVVRLDPATGLSTLFRPLPKAKVRPTLDVEYRPKHGGLTLRFSAREALGMPEQTLLLTLLGLAQEHYAAASRNAVVIDRHTQGVGQDLWRALHEGQIAADGETLHIRTSWRELAGRCGSQGGRSQQLREEQLRRLCEVVVWEKADDALRSFRQSRLVSVIQGNDLRLHLAVNCRLAGAVMGSLYAQVSLAERQSLATDTAQATHAFLSTTLRSGRSMPIGIDTLMHRLWSDAADGIPEGTLRARRKAVRDGLEAIGALPSWTVTWPRPGIAEVQRRKNGAEVRARRSQAPVPAIPDKGLSTAAVPAAAEHFDATRFLVSVADSPRPGTMGNEPMDYRQRGDEKNPSKNNNLATLEAAVLI
jgi:hypothetical protein